MDYQLLSKNNSLIIRGLAILSIVFHNFLHFYRFGFAQENEFSFTSENAAGFFSHLGEGHIFANCLSFLGWLGVPVFIFLTGYGFAINGFPENRKGWQKDFIKRGFLKLLALLVPALLFFFALDFVHHDIWPQLLKRSTYLTLLANFVYPYVFCNPGVYWYFGLTFQFYLLWALIGKHLNNKRLLAYSLLFLLGFGCLCIIQAPNLLSIYRNCFTGWFFIFAIGVYLAQNRRIAETVLDKSPIWMAAVFSILGILLIILMNRWLISWLFVPIVSLFWFLSLEKILLHTHVVSGIFRWIGKLSACIFVCHPIARTITVGLYSHFNDSLILATFFYLTLTAVISVVYYRYYKWILPILNPTVSTHTRQK